MSPRLITMDNLKKSERGDHSTILEVFKFASPDKPEASDLLHIAVYDICWFAIHGKVQIDCAVSILSEALSLHKDLPSVIADVLVVLDTDSHVIDGPNVRDRYLSLLRSCGSKIIPDYTIKERLEFETLGDSNIIKNLKSTQTRFIKTKTRLFYKQQKFNLFREESEGYAKLLTELNPGEDSKEKAVYVLEVVKSLIGCFNLDPNRVLDIILESFECRPELHNFFVTLLKSFSCTPNTLCQVIGFKFGFYQNNIEETSPSLYLVTALLVKNDLLKLTHLYDLLLPDEASINQKQKQEHSDAQAYIKQLSSVSTTSSDKPDADVKPQEKEETPQVEEDNQKLGLCAALIDVGDWKHAEELMNHFPEYYGVSHPHIAKKICNLVHTIIDKLYLKRTTTYKVARRTLWQLESGIQIRQVEDFTELFNEVFPMLLALGPYFHIDSILIWKIVELSKDYMSQNGNKGDKGTEQISSVIEICLLPSLSLMDCNCSISGHIWGLLRLFPYQSRYHIYARWKNYTQSTHPLLLRKKAESLKRLKYIMKRLSKDNVKPSGRQIGKLSHSNPGYVFDYILSQIQTWDNLIGPVVDSLKFLTSLAYDVLAYCIIEALANPEKDRMKHDGINISVWLQSLSNFGGTVFKKYPIEISGLLQYVANQLKDNKSLDLLILKEVVHKMAGIESSEEMTPDQVDAMTGGDLLRSEGGYFNQLRNVKKSSQRLKDALLEQDLAIPLFLLMAQQKQCILFQEQEQSHLKLIGKLYDQCQDTFVQFGNFLATNLNIDEYARRIPPISALFSDYNIPPEAAFFLSRPTINYSISTKFDELKKHDKSLKNVNNRAHTQKYIETVQSVVNPIVQSIISNEYIKKSVGELSSQFFVTFWCFTMYDLTVPTSSYEREVGKLKALCQSEENKDVTKKKKERELVLLAKLQDEEKSQHEHCQRVMARLNSEKEHWFQPCKAAKNETITIFLQLCVFPRCKLTPVDALYCARFINLIHQLKTLNFSTLLCYDRIFCDITHHVAVLSENEANRYGLFLNAILETIMRWHSNKAIFEKECAYFPGFVTKFKVSQPKLDTPQDHVDYENYRHLCHKWQFKITKALLKCLESSEFIQIRNALLVLTRVAQFYPVVTNLGIAIEKRIDNIRINEKESRPDIFALATAYSGILKTKKSSFIPESEFHLKDSRSGHNNSAKNSSRTTIKTEKPEGTKNQKQNDAKHDQKTVAAKTSSDKSSSERSSSSKSRTSHKEAEHNGIDTSRVKSSSIRVKEERADSSSPMRKEDKNLSNSSEKSGDKRDRRSEDRHDKSSAQRPEKENDSNHGQRRSNDSEGEHREHKRRRTNPTKSSLDVSSSDRATIKDDDKNGKIVSNDKSHSKEVTESSEKSKTKGSRKRDHGDEASGEPRRRRVKTEEDPEKQRREEKSPMHINSAASLERRAEREEKRHRRSSSVTKKRSA